MMPLLGNAGGENLFGNVDISYKDFVENLHNSNMMRSKDQVKDLSTFDRITIQHYEHA